MTLLAAALNKTRKGRQDVSAFAALIETPANLAVGFKLPANAELVVATTSVLASTTKLLDCGDRSLYASAGAANSKHHIGWMEASVNVKKASGAPGTVSLYIRDGMGVLFKVAQG